MIDRENMTEVVILTNNYKVKGWIALVPGARLTDYIDESKDFIAVTDAHVWNRHNLQKIMGSRFLDINREDIEIIAPSSALLEETQEYAS
jgi:hypothetical protein